MTDKAFGRFSPDNPNPFLDLDSYRNYIRDLFVNSSGIRRSLFDSCVTFHSSLEYDYGGDVSSPIHELLNWKSFKRFGRNASDDFYAAFLMNEDGSVWQAVLSLSADELVVGGGKDGVKPYRYVAPCGIGDTLFTPAIPLDIRERIADVSGVDVPLDMSVSFWEWLQHEPECVRLLTEGAKKGLRALSQGYVGMAMYGCRCGVDTGTGSLKQMLKPYATPGSFWAIGFDQDAKSTTRAKVAAARSVLVKALTANLAFSGVMEWKVEQGKGLDDITSLVLDKSFERSLLFIEKQLSKADVLKTPPVDVLADQIGRKFEGSLLWNNEYKTAMVYCPGEGLWKPKDDFYIESVLQSQAKAMGVRGISDRYIVSLRKFLLRLPGFFCEMWNERQGILPFQDGVLDIESGNFEKHHSTNHLTWTLPRDYSSDDSDDWAVIREWLYQAWNAEDVQRILYFFAAVLRGQCDYQKFLYLIGSGGSGKGTLSRLLESVIGSRNTWSGTVESLGDKNDIARLLGKPLAIFPDQDKVTSGLQLFKNLTGGDNICGKRLYQDSFDFKWRGMAIVTANSPVLLGAGSWLKRRAIVVRCDYQPEVVRDLDAEFENEITAFTRYLLSIPVSSINSMLRGYKLDIADGDSPYSASSLDTSSFWDIAIRQDSIAAWIDECVVYERGAFTRVGRDKDEWLHSTYNPSMSTLFGSYHAYCRGAGLHGKSVNTFAEELLELSQKTLGYKYVERTRKGSASIRGMSGIRLRLEHEPTITDLFSERTTDVDGQPNSQPQDGQPNSQPNYGQPNGAVNHSQPMPPTLESLQGIPSVNTVNSFSKVGYEKNKNKEERENKKKPYVETNNREILDWVDRPQSSQPLQDKVYSHSQQVDRNLTELTVDREELSNVTSSNQPIDNVTSDNNPPTISPELCSTPYYKRGDRAKAYPTFEHYSNRWECYCTIQDIDWVWGKSSGKFYFGGCSLTWRYKGEVKTAFVPPGNPEWILEKLGDRS